MTHALLESRPGLQQRRVTAASLRNTRDYRVLVNPGNAMFLGRLEQFRAMSEAISSEEAIKRIKNRQPDTAPDWSRIVLQGGYGVGSGHQFALPSMGLEINDAIQIFPDLRTAREPARLAAILNLSPGETVQLDENHHPRFRVIDPGTWAQYFQRHLLQAANETYNFLQNKWGVPDEAQSFRVRVGPLLSTTPLNDINTSTATCVPLVIFDHFRLIHGVFLWEKPGNFARINAFNGVVLGNR